jgi:ribonuclease VapC
MSRIVVDTSVVVAFIKGEPGAEFMSKASPGSLLSALSLAEVIAVFVRMGDSLDDVREHMREIDLDVVDFDRELAEQTGALIAFTKRFGLSLADRACLALAKRENLPVLTADRAWRDLKVGVDIQLIR